MIKEFFAHLKTASWIILVLTIFSVLIHVYLNGVNNISRLSNHIFFNFYYGLPISIVNGLYFNRLDSIMPWEKNPKIRAWLGFLGSIFITMLTIIILNYIMMVLIQGQELGTLFSQSNKLTYLIALVITIIVSSVLHAIGFFKEIGEEKRKSELLRQEILQSELNALKAHVDPHFLFNSFNALSGLIDEDKDKAQTFLQGLTKIYRHILDNRNEQTNTIHNEITFANTYLALHQTRFENSIFLEIDLNAETANLEIASLSLQLLLENAVKHNAFSEENPLKIKIFGDSEYLTISNNRRKRKNVMKGAKLRLQNISDRYNLLTNKKVIITEEENDFIVKIPVL